MKTCLSLSLCSSQHKRWQQVMVHAISKLHTCLALIWDNIWTRTFHEWSFASSFCYMYSHLVTFSKSGDKTKQYVLIHILIQQKTNKQTKTNKSKTKNILWAQLTHILHFKRYFHHIAECSINRSATIRKQERNNLLNWDWQSHFSTAWLSRYS